MEQRGSYSRPRSFYDSSSLISMGLQIRNISSIIQKENKSYLRYNVHIQNTQREGELVFHQPACPALVATASAGAKGSAQRGAAKVV
jgi:hypothetical protein